MSYESIRVTRDGPLLTITLNRPERLNAMAPEMADEIGLAFYGPWRRARGAELRARARVFVRARICLRAAIAAR